jgi:hypothetical protein
MKSPFKEALPVLQRPQFGQVAIRKAVIDILIGVRARISPPGAWCRHELAKTAGGRPCDVDSPNAVAWCVLGALKIEKVNWLKKHPRSQFALAGSNGVVTLHWKAEEALRKAGVEVRQDPSFVNVNDEANKATVLRMLDLAIDKAKTL